VTLEGEQTMSLEHKLALVSGASRGIGRAIARELGRRGAGVIGTATTTAGADAISQDLQERGINGCGISLDVTIPEAVEAALKMITAEFGSPAILVNNAGITRDGLLLRMKEEDWNLVLQVNLNGTFNCTKAVLQTMTKQRYGRIVNIASIVGVMGNAGQANYAASKAAVIGFTKTVGREYASRNVTVNAVAPGFIDTAMTHGLPADVKETLQKQIPLGRLGTPADIAAAVRFLVSEDAAYITGHVLHVNGGMLMV
jgi:3-oxoacyl-[acyl-carrier protein] reductase